MPGMKGLRQEYQFRVTKGGKSVLKGTWANAISGKQLDSVRKETPAVSVFIQHLETEKTRDKKGQPSSPAPEAKAETDGKKPSKGSGRRGESLLQQEAKLRSDKSLGESVRIRHEIIGTLPCVSIASLNQDANMGKIQIPTR